METPFPPHMHRLLQESQYRKMNIKLDFSNFSSSDEVFKNYLLLAVIPKLKKRLEETFQVRNSKFINGFGQVCQQVVNIPAQY